MRSTIPTAPAQTTIPVQALAQRRGIALMLVVVTLATATILTTSYLVSSENTPTIGQAAQDRATTEWSARSAANIVEAAMETTVDWRTLAATGLLLDNKKIMGADVCVAVTSLTGTDAGDDGTVLMTVIAKAGGIETLIQRVVSERELGTYRQALDPELKEFGVFTKTRLDIEGGSRVVPWTASPVARAGTSAKLGVGFPDAASFTTSFGSLNNNITAYLPPDATGGLEATFLSSNTQAITLPVNPWATTAETPSTIDGIKSQLPLIPLGPLTITLDSTLQAADYTVPVIVEGGRTIILDGSSGAYLFSSEGGGDDGLRLEDSILRIKGNVVMAVYDDLRIKSSAFEFVDNATLTIYHANSVLIEDSVIGADPALLADAARSYTDLAQWTNPRRVRFIQLNRSADSSVDKFAVRGKSLVVASIHAPAASMSVIENSFIAGRASADTIVLRDNSAILVDPIFDNNLGLTSFDTSPLYDTNGDPVSGLAVALSATTPIEGFNAAMSRVLGALPVQAVPSDAPDNGANARHAGTVSRIREWPVLVRMQESTDGTASVLFDVPRDETVASSFGGVAIDALYDIIVNEGGTRPGGIEPTVGLSVDDVTDALGLQW